MEKPKVSNKYPVKGKVLEVITYQTKKRKEKNERMENKKK